MIDSKLSFDRSRAYNADAAQAIPGAVNSNVRLAGNPVPLCFERGAGAYLYDLDGNRFIDYMLGMGPSILGHAPQQVIDAVAKSLAMGQMLGGQHRAELELARLVQQIVPSAGLVRIGMTGSEAVQAALRVSRAATGRRKFVKFEGQYHGWFDNVLISHAPPPPAADAPAGAPRAPHLETRGQSPAGIEDVIIMPWNDADAIERLLAERGAEIAAVITEPMMCNTGAILPVPGFLERLREATAKHGVVLIFDEVITGFRVALGGAQERFGVTPDLSTFAKAMAAGFPIAALVGRKDLMELFGTGAVNHSGTYNSNVPSIAAGVATLTALAADNGALLNGIEATGTLLIEGLRRAAKDQGINLRVSGVGAVFNTHFTDDVTVTDYQSYRRTDLKRQAAFLAALVERGIRPIGRGTWFVSSAHTADDVAETLDAASAAFTGMRAA